MLNNFITIISLLVAGLLSYFSYKYGKNKKENEIIKNNEEKRKKYNKNKFNNINDVINELSK